MRKLLPYTTILLVLAMIYAGWTMYSRRNQNARLEHAAEQKEAQTDKKLLDAVGGGNLKIVTFYSSTPVIRKGERALVCYGVAGASEVKIEPGVEGIAPSLSRCVETHPAADTTYTLTARDAKGHTATQDCAVKVGK